MCVYTCMYIYICICKCIYVYTYMGVYIYRVCGAKHPVRPQAHFCCEPRASAAARPAPRWRGRAHGFRARALPSYKPRELRGPLKGVIGLPQRGYIYIYIHI